MLNIRLIKLILGKFFVAYGCVMCLPIIVALYYQESTLFSFFSTAVFTVIIGLILLYDNYTIEGRIGLRESYIIVAAVWFSASVLGAFPFYISDTVPVYIDALFESTSGLTTTGASVINVIENLPKSILFWRSMTHWLGGMGIIVLFIALLPNIGIGAVHLFNAEATGPTADKVLPRVRGAASYLWRIYASFTLVLMILLHFAGMSIFDAVNHALATMATGGFSTRTASIAAYDSLAIELIIIVFMLIAGVSFNLYIAALNKGVSAIFKDEEFRAYFTIFLVSAGVVAYSLFRHDGYFSLTALRQALFQVASIMSTTGFATVDFDQWPPLAKMVLFVLMFIGGSAGSTSGGIKVARVILLLKFAWSHIKHAFNPQLVININYQGKTVDSRVLTSIGVFFFIFIIIAAIASIVLTGTGLKPFDAISASVAMLGSIGPGFGAVGPALNYSLITQLGKVTLIFCMLLGRLELFTILVLLQPGFWRNHKAW